MLSEKPWRAESVTLFCAAQFVCLCLGLTLGGVLRHVGVPGFQQAEDFGNIFFATISFQGAAWLLIGFFLRQHQTGWGAAFGWHSPQLKPALFTAVRFIGILLPVILLLQYGCLQGLERLGWPPEDQAAVLLLLKAKAWWMTAYFAGFAVVIAPVAEEFIFRGMLFPFVRQLGYPRLAWFGLSAAFALIHLNTAVFVPLFVFSLAQTWLYDKTDNLLAPITAHALFNAANLGLLFLQNHQAPA